MKFIFIAGWFKVMGYFSESLQVLLTEGTFCRDVGFLTLVLIGFLLCICHTTVSAKSLCFRTVRRPRSCFRSFIGPEIPC